MSRRKKEAKNEIILIRCTADTKRKMKVFQATYGIPNLEEALKKLLTLAESHPEFVTRRYV